VPAANYTSISSTWCDSQTTGDNFTWISWAATASTGYTNAVWNEWTTGTTTGSSWVTYSTSPRKLTPEEKAKAEKAALRGKLSALKARLKELRAKREARERARNLLKELLTAAEWSEYRRYGSVQIVGSLGGKYEVGGATTGMVTQLDENWNPVQKICYHPSTQYAVEDRVAAVILDIKCDESRVRTQGNKHSWGTGEERRAKARRLHKRLVLCEAAQP